MVSLSSKGCRTATVAQQKRKASVMRRTNAHTPTETVPATENITA